MSLDGKAFRVDCTRTPNQFRVAGFVTMILGLLVLMAGVFFLCMGSAFLAEHLFYPVFPELRPESASTDRTHAGALLFGSIVSVFGLLAVSSSVYQIAFGRRAIMLVRIMIAIMLLLFLMGGIAALITGDRVPGVV